MKIGARNQLFLVLAVFVAVTLAGGLASQAQTRVQVRLEGQIDKLVPDLRKPVPDLAQAQARIDQAERRIQVARSAFPSRDESIEISSILDGLAKASDVNIVKQAAATTNEKSEGNIEFFLLSFDLTLEGEVQKLLDFVSGLDGVLKTSRVDSATITVPSQQEELSSQNSGKGPTLARRPSLDMKLSVYTGGKEVKVTEQPPQKARQVSRRK